MTINRIITFPKILLQCSRSNPSFIKNTQQINTFRFLSIDHPNKTPKKVLKKEKEKLRTYVVERYIEYVKNYTKVVENRFPSAMNMYRVFSVGIKDFLSDLKKYISLRIKLAREGFEKMTRQEIELYQKMPSDMWRIAPVLILSAIPFGNYIIFPLAFLKPRTLLCSHFWSIQQRSEYTILELKERLRYNRPVFRALQAKLDTIPEGPSKIKWKKVIALLGSGVHPTVDDVIACRDLFHKNTYDISNLSFTHIGYLLEMHGLKKGIFRKKKLKFRAVILLELDKAIIREGGAEALSTDSLRTACHMRGLNSSHLTNQDMVKWLHQWLQVSQHVNKSTYSLLLHCPIFFAYNHPQNWMLIY